MWQLKVAFLGVLDFLFVLGCSKVRFFRPVTVQAVLCCVRAWLSLLIVDESPIPLLAVSIALAVLILMKKETNLVFLSVILFPCCEEYFFRSAVLFGVGSEHLRFGWRMILSIFWFLSAHDFQQIRSRFVRAFVYAWVANSFGLSAAILVHGGFNLIKLVLFKRNN